MSDDIDRAQPEQERLLAKALRAKRPGGPRPTGSCHYCGEHVTEGLRWCDTVCRNDWEVEQENLRHRRR